MTADWARIKRKQAREADQVAAYAAGIGEHGIANACYQLAGILRRQAREEAGIVADPDAAGNGQRSPGGVPEQTG